MSFATIGLLCLWASSTLALNISAKGVVTQDSESFVLELDTATQVATRLVAKASASGGQDDFNFLLPVQGRESDGFLVSARKASTIIVCPRTVLTSAIFFAGSG